MDRDVVSVGASRAVPVTSGEAGAGSRNLHVSEENSADVTENSVLKNLADSVEVAENGAKEAEEGAITNLNGFADYGRREHPQRDREVQLAMQMADAVEDDAHAVARSLTALLSSLKSALSEVTTSSVANMRLENEAAGQVQDAAIDAASKGNRFVNACLRLNEEMKGMERVANQLAIGGLLFV
ncbi:hypothetical protein AXG93_2210s1160 [Marchantia polymorpha subsp. ruderalis]|uniref:BLOC-1-related complex subunit 6 C-terminal helix domain-containing protein n=1 Tax=Marchantia polymorpha subsp. ruderalis TaxID=1480154 RepID=A0A176VY74_MARPO|nr:hypothetical protein AXG93_2210s1160 [Marchantia polymorpha subsp. ruderalis]